MGGRLSKSIFYITRAYAALFELGIRVIGYQLLTAFSLMCWSEEGRKLNEQFGITWLIEALQMGLQCCLALKIECYASSKGVDIWTEFLIFQFADNSLVYKYA